LARVEADHPQLFRPLLEENPTIDSSAHFHAAADIDLQVMGYVHWVYHDQTVSDQYPSCLYARRLRLPGEAASAALKCAAEFAENVAEKAFKAAFQARSTAQAGLCSLPPLETAPADGEDALSPLGGERPVVPLLRLEDALLLASHNAVPTPIIRNSRPVLRANVTPRGSGYTAKFERQGNVEYLGFFDDVQDAQAAYEDAAATWAAQEMGKTPPTAPKFESAVPSGATLTLRRLPSTQLPKPLRAAQLRLHGQCFVDSGELRRRAAVFESLHVPAPPPVSQRGGALYNSVVSVYDLPPCYTSKFWFVYLYVADMRWCHLVALEQCGHFGESRGFRQKWRLVREGHGREIDVSADRCRRLGCETVAKKKSADNEIFDIAESTESDAAPVNGFTQAQ